jgi:hypothetical protein
MKAGIFTLVIWLLTTSLSSHLLEHLSALHSGTSIRYAVPVHADAPPVMDVIFVEEHDPHVNPLGVKGVGEIAMVASRPRSRTRFFTPPESVSAPCRSHRTSCFESRTRGQHDH